MSTEDQVKKYYDALIASYDVLTDAVAKSSERGLKVTSQLTQDIANGQREALELGKKLSTETKDFGQLYAALVEATTAAQGRALAFADFANKQALEAGSETRTYVEKLVEVNRETARAAVELARAWATENPMAAMFRQGVEAMTPATKKETTKSAASNRA
jgi:hypothetical protein